MEEREELKGGVWRKTRRKNNNEFMLVLKCQQDRKCMKEEEVKR